MIRNGKRNEASERFYGTVEREYVAHEDEFTRIVEALQVYMHLQTKDKIKMASSASETQLETIYLSD